MNVTSLESISLSIALLVFSGLIGWWARALWHSRTDSVLEAAVVSAALGLGILSLALFGLSAAGLLAVLSVLSAVPFVGVWLLVAVVGLSVLLRRRLPVDQIGEWLRGLLSLPRLLAVVPVLGVSLVVLIPAFAPPSMADWDSLAYHLAIPKLHIEHGGFYYISFSSHSNFPFLMEMLYMPGLAVGDPVAAKLMNYWVGLLLVAAVYMLAKRHLHAKSAPLAALAVAGMPIVLWEATTAYIDLAMALYTVVAAHLMLCCLDTRERGHFVGCAVAAGFAASTKLTGLALAPLLLVWLVVGRWAADRKLEWRRGLVFAGVALLVCSPWYIKTIVYTGSPVYPFFYSVFGGRDWTSALAANYSMLQQKFGVGHDFGSFILLPYDLTFNSQAFYDRPGLFVGPILLVAVPLLFFVRRWSSKMMGLALFFGAQFGIWFALTQQSRYLIPAFAVLAVIVAAIAYQDERARITRGALWAVFAATAAFGVWTLYPSVIDTAPVAFGRETRHAYLSRTLDIYPAEKWIGENLPKSARVALYGDTRGFYLDRDYVWADPGHNAAFTREFASCDDLLRYLRSRRITHVLINFRFSFPDRENAGGVAKSIYDAIDRGRLEPVYPTADDFRGVAVYEIR